MPRSPTSPFTYAVPAGTTAVPNTTITVDQHNNFTNDVATTFNTIQPITYGGTGAATKAGAQANLGITSVSQVNYLATGGTANAQTLTPADQLLTLTDGVSYNIIITTAPTGTATMNVSSTGAKALRIISAGADIDIVAGNLLIAERYSIEYSTAAASGAGGWIITNPAPLIGALTSLASATTTDLGTIGSHNINITGTTTITAFGSTAAIGQPIYYLQFPSGLTIAANATSLITPTGINLVLGAGSSAVASYLGSGNWRILSWTDPTVTTITAPALAGYLFGGAIANNSGAPTTSIDIGVGTCIDSTGVKTFLLPAFTKNIALAWALGTNQGSLDTGSVGNGTYHVFGIMRPDSGNVDYVTSLSASAPTLPANYVYFRRIGSIIRSGGAVLAFIQDGDFFHFNTASPPADYSGNARAKAALTLTVPGGIRVKAMMTLGFTAVNTTATSTVYDGANTSIGSAFSVSNNNTNASTLTTYAEQYTNTSSQIQYAAVNTQNATTTVTTLGWIDPRGRT
jgi:hypothetical protein